MIEVFPLLTGLGRSDQAQQVCIFFPCCIEQRSCARSGSKCGSPARHPLLTPLGSPSRLSATSPLIPHPSALAPQAVNVVDLVVTVASVLQLILDRAGLMGGLHVLRVFQPLKVVTASPSLREVRSRSGSGQA